ncbi:MAG: hypothetical protein K2Y37_18575 [Pirellulales bacterium]|nr:hypothetical protein [Pirellulales bacterium]
MRVMKLLGACASLWLLAGCAASVHPLCDPATAEPDKRLVGMWERRDGNEGERVSYLHIAREAKRPLDASRSEPEPGLMRCWATGHDEKSLLGDDAGGARLLSTRIGYVDYASIVIDDLAQREATVGVEPANSPAAEQSPPVDPARKPRFLLVRYDVTDDVLVVWPANQDAVADSIQSGRIAGVARAKVPRPGKLDFGKWEEVTLTATTAELRAFFEAGGAEKWFNEESKTVYHRLR